MAEIAITGALSRLGEFAASEAKQLRQVGDDMVLLRDRLHWLLAFIGEADRKRRAGTDGLTRVWVRQTRDVAFATEDALDNFFYKDHWWKKIYIRYMLTKKIKEIKSRLKQISENQQVYKIEHTPPVTLTSSNIITSAWLDDLRNTVGYHKDAKNRFDDLKNTVGFDKDAATLGKMLGDDNEGPLKFISINGEGGIGKFTLAEVIFYKVKVNFGIRMWYNMQLDSNKEVLLQGIYNQAVAKTRLENPSFSTKNDTHDVATKLVSLLADKTYLLILAGIQSKTMLNWLKPRLPDGKNGSKVVLLLDTESEAVALQAENLNGDLKKRMHLLSRLDKERSAELFLSRVIRKDAPDYEMENMRMYGKIVYNITRGYPLAIVLLCGLLRFKEKPSQWEAVLQEINPGPDNGSNKITGDVLSRDNNLNTRTPIERIFWASFEDLPNDLKSCYLYFAVFARNTVQYADRIVRMWIAEGFIKPRIGKTMEEQGDNYLKELVLRYLVQIVWLNDSGGILGVRVHMKLHGFLESEVHEAGFVEIHGAQHVFVPPSVRRLSFQSYDGRYTILSNDLPKLRSFVCRVLGGDKSGGNTDVNKETGKAVNKYQCGMKLNACCSFREENKETEEEEVDLQCDGAMESGTSWTTEEMEGQNLNPRVPSPGGEDETEGEEMDGQNLNPTDQVPSPSGKRDDENANVNKQKEIEKVNMDAKNLNPTDEVPSPGGKRDYENTNVNKQKESEEVNMDGQVLNQTAPNPCGIQDQNKEEKTDGQNLNPKVPNLGGIQDDHPKKSGACCCFDGGMGSGPENEDLKKKQQNKAQNPNVKNDGQNLDLTKEVQNTGVGKETKKDFHDIKFLHGPTFCGLLKRRCRSKFLRVISIMGLNIMELPKEIGDLIQLRYLLVDSNDLKNLPSSIERLLNLQTLDIRETKVMTIDPGFWKIAGLRHILAENLTLPASIEKELDELQTLHGVKPAQGDKWDAENFPLNKMTNLRSVELHGFIGPTHGAALESALTKMHLLSHLKVKGNEIPSCIFTGQGLQFLQTVVLKGQVVWPPARDFENLRTLRPNLVHIKLKNTKDPSEDIQAELAKRGFRRFKHAPVYELSYKVSEAKE